jgi:hypothetical protein
LLQVAGLLAGTLLIAQSGAAGTITAKSALFPDVSAAVAAANDGDTVIVPATPTPVSWTSTLTITKGITIQGAGSDKTVILDDVARTSANRNGAIVLFSSVTSGQSPRLTGFTFRHGALTTGGDGAIRFLGTCPSIRLDHCHFDHIYSRCILISGWLYGVIDHCTFDLQPRGGGFAQVNHPLWGNSVSGWGSWADFPYFGSEKFIFFEDNVITNNGTAANGGSIDATIGGRYVARHNIFNNTNLFYHGSDTGVGPTAMRGARAIEIYSNRFTATFPIPAGQNRGGSLLWHDNTYTGTFKGGMGLRIYRLAEFERSGFKGADGTSPWDCNATEPDGTHVDGHAPYTFATGTHIGGNDSLSVVVSGTQWKTDQWAGYSVTNTSRASPYFNGCNFIVSNTNNTLTLQPHFAHPPLPKFNTGDAFAIHKVLIVIDQPGRGQGDLLVGNPPAPVWPHQALEPCYSWNNTLNNSNLNFSNKESQSILRENHDYYNQTASFDGTVGVGVGNPANRPKTCTPGVAYWATDQGEWDSTHSGPHGQLYVCTAPNTWTLKYKPYIYPNPLTTASAKPEPALKPQDQKRTTGVFLFEIRLPVRSSCGSVSPLSEKQ